MVCFLGLRVGFVIGLFVRCGCLWGCVFLLFAFDFGFAGFDFWFVGVQVGLLLCGTVCRLRV